jgi:S-adenosylmethionine:tRNA ribosyltransferase-isomerase
MWAMTVAETSAPVSRATPSSLSSSSSKKIPPARAPRSFLVERMLHIDPRAGAFRDAHVRDLPDFLRANDVLVVNDAATLPASLPARTRDGRSMELRLIAERAPSIWSAALLGEGDWRTPTEHRPAPPHLSVGDELRVGAMIARVIELGPHSPREVVVRFDRRDAALWSELYAVGRLIQYAHVPEPLPLWEMQSAYASRPWAVEMPSAGRPLEWEILDALRRKGVELRTLTHAAGLSSTGDDAIDRALPLVERYEIPRATIEAIDRARANGGRVVAVGTSVVRALEGSAVRHDGRAVAESAATDLKIDENFRPIVIDGLFTGIHDDPATSHHSLLRAFAPARLLERAHAHAAAAGYVGHELGDSTLILSA